MKRISHAVMWRRLDGPGHDVCTYGPAEDGWRLLGSAVFLSAGLPCSLGYLVDADPRWQVRSAHVFGTVGSGLVDAFIVAAAAGGHWLVDGRPHGGLAGCVDLDFGFTPALKLFILRRLAIDRAGQERSSAVAHLALPGMTLEPMEQRYKRLSAVSCVFAVADARQSTVLRLDAQQAVAHYPGRWEREGLDGSETRPRPPLAASEVAMAERPARPRERRTAATSVS